MKPAPFLRIASVLTLIHCIMHTAGGVFSAARHGAEEIAVIDTMKFHHFDVFGIHVAWRYFFIGPAVTELLIAACLALAFTTAAGSE